jgi:EAL domain-containing protein (putative c-di-GMP-specific phosphodiesterase class I)
MAEDLGIACIAEGVECAAEAEACAHAGFPYAQGYFLGRPSQVGVPPQATSAPETPRE